MKHKHLFFILLCLTKNIIQPSTEASKNAARTQTLNLMHQLSTQVVTREDLMPLENRLKAIDPAHQTFEERQLCQTLSLVINYKIYQRSNAIRRIFDQQLANDLSFYERTFKR